MTARFLTVLGLCVLMLPRIAHSDITNGDFETGTLSGWTVAGSAAAQTAALGVTPPQGTYQGYIETTGNYTALAPAVVASLGVPGSAIMAFGTGAPFNGTGMSQSITVNAGDVLSFDWNFITSELTEPPTYNDFAFFTISGSAFLLASRNSSTYDTSSPPPGFEGQTDWAVQTYTFSSAGTYTLGFGVLNVGDAGYNSALLLDAINIPASVPEPGCLGIIACGAMPLRRRWLRN